MAPSACQDGAPQTPCRARAHAQSISWRALACHSGNYAGTSRYHHGTMPGRNSACDRHLLTLHVTAQYHGGHAEGDWMGEVLRIKGLPHYVSAIDEGLKAKARARG